MWRCRELNPGLGGSPNESTYVVTLFTKERLKSDKNLSLGASQTFREEQLAVLFPYTQWGLHHSFFIEYQEE